MDAEPICPYCGKPLLEGYIRSRDHLSWSSREYQSVPLPFCGVVLPKAKAWYCPACKKVILDLKTS